MGITGLIGLVDNASSNLNITQLKGSVCVIDGYGWLHKACYGCAEQVFMGQHTDQYVNYCLKRTQMVIDAGVKPIIVFDGQRLPAKEVTHKNRQSIRHNTRQKIELLLSDGNASKAKELMRNCIEVTPEMARNLMRALRAEGIDFVVAPFEADAQMAYLVNNGFADFVITEDSDLMVYNCRLCLFKMDPNGNGRLVDMTLISQCLGNNFDSNKFRHMSILSGCDYLPNLPGIGLQRAKKFFKLTANTDLKRVLYKVPNYLNMSKKVTITAEYVNDFIKADNTFKYQLVFCPKQRKLVPLTPYEKGVDTEDLKYAGSYFDDTFGEDFAFEYAIGNVDTKSLKIIDNYCFQPKADSIWSKEWIDFKKKFTTNRIVLHKLNPNKVLTTPEDNKSQRSPTKESFTQLKDVSFRSEYFRKRLKVDENVSTNCSQLFKQYSSEVIEENKTNESNTQRIYSTRSQTYSRNIFKVTKDSTEEQTIQSKYFSNSCLQSSSNEDSVPQKSSLTTRVLNEKKLSQYSLNSSGNTAIDSSFDETFTLSDSDRSEISETSDEEILFTNLKPQKNGSIKRLAPLNSSFTSSSKKTDIRDFFKSF